MKKRQILVIQTLHPCNIVFVLLLSAIYKIVFWRVQHLPWILTRRFEVAYPADYLSVDEWHTNQQDASLHWKASEKIPTFRMLESIAGECIDFTGCWQQWLAIQYEDRYQFLNLVNKWIGAKSGGVRTYVMSDRIDVLLRSANLKLPAIKNTRVSSFFLFLDSAWSWALVFRTLVKQILLMFRGKVIKLRDRYRFIWSYVTVDEVSAGDNRTDIAFMVRRGILSAEDNLYLLPATLSTAQKEHLGEGRIEWAPSNSMRFLKLTTRLIIVCQLLYVIIKKIFGHDQSGYKTLNLQLAISGLPWVYVARRFRPDCYLCSVSMSWPEAPEVAVMRSMGVYTVNWHYSANIFHFCKENSAYKDLGLACGIAISHEIIVWNNEVAAWIDARRVNGDFKVNVIGPLMCGDFRWLELSPNDARHRVKIELPVGARMIAVFDVPAATRDTLLKIGRGPTTVSEEMVTAFYKDIISIVTNNKNLHLLIKPKRSLRDNRRVYASNLLELINDPGSVLAREQRLHIVDPDSDTYKIVALADICVGVPFTSPIFAAQYSGRLGVFHDPLSEVNYLGQEPLFACLTRNRHDLAMKIEANLGAELPVTPNFIEDPAIKLGTLLIGLRRAS